MEIFPFTKTQFNPLHDDDNDDDDDDEWVMMSIRWVL
jgi:hypothetical protein